MIWFRMEPNGMALMVLPNPRQPLQVPLKSPGQDTTPLFRVSSCVTGVRLPFVRWLKNHLNSLRSGQGSKKKGSRRRDKEKERWGVGDRKPRLRKDKNI